MNAIGDQKVLIGYDLMIKRLIELDSEPEMVDVMDNGKPVKMIGHMDAYDGILVIGGRDKVMLFDGMEWKTIVAPYK